MSDLISREDLVKELNAQFAVGNITKEIANDILNHIPFVEPERTAKAIDNVIHVICCEKCERVVSIIDDYCPRCGAKLDWSENNE